MGSVSSKGERLGSFKDYNEIFVDPQLKRGAMVEIERGWFKHWALCESTTGAIVWCYHVTSHKKNSIGSNGRNNGSKGWICYETLRDIIQKEGADGTDVKPGYDLCRVNNQESRAQRLGLNELNLNIVFAELNRLKDTMVDYKLNGWSSQVTKAEWTGMGVGAGVGVTAGVLAKYVFVEGIGWAICTGGVVFVVLGFGLYLGLKYYKTQVTCDGVIVDTDDRAFTAVVRKGRFEKAYPVRVTQYRGISTYSNGNRDFQETGVLTGDVCPGDHFWGTAIFTADNQNGCRSGAGVSAIRALYRVWTITGKCNSTCQVFDSSLGHSTQQWDPPVNGWGIAGRRRDISGAQDVDQEVVEEI
ncbi:unnamed protein product [Medioppia subpectinata]|uniref:LRAT domain-containing protein n=1 Tax=Medioppia subpectinata TaxID=1979941 RepID=A0A7R9KQK7_9ACAR|nr:unnamed protein product [Medioppia subpectinata]CAG2107866.1 unnamed protein product [Medioppia subpectinata]